MEYRDSTRQEVYAITGVMDADDDGLPVFGPDFTATVVHELNHPYADPVIQRHLAALGPPADLLHARSADAFRRQAIGSGETLVIESMVRAAVARYRLATEGTEAGSLDGSPGESPVRVTRSSAPSGIL